MVAECVLDPQGNIRFEHFFVVGIQHVGLETNSQADAIVQHHLLHPDGNRLGEESVATCRRGLPDQVAGQFGVLVDADIEVDHDLHIQRARVAAGRHFAEEQVVGDRYDAVVQGAQLHRAQADIEYIPVLAAEPDPVAHLERAVKYDHHPRHQRCQQVPGGETDTDEYRTAQHRQHLFADLEAEQDDQRNRADVDEKVKKRIQALQHQPAFGMRPPDIFHHAVDELEQGPRHEDDHRREGEPRQVDGLADNSEIAGVGRTHLLRTGGSARRQHRSQQKLLLH